MEIKNLYLLNSKPKEEPKFSTSVAQTCAGLGINCNSMNADEFSYYIPSDVDSSIRIFHNERELEKLTNTFFFVRTWKGRHVSTALLCSALKKLGIQHSDHVANTAHDIRNSKIAQVILLKGLVRFPNTWLATAHNAALVKEKMGETLGEELVVKDRGGLGNNVWKLNIDHALEKVQELQAENPTEQKVFIFQEIVENTHDTRVVVLHDEIVIAIQRSATDGFYNNVARGAIPEIVEINDEVKQLCIIAARECGLDLAGVDVVNTKSGPMIFEVNKAPDIQSFSDQMGVDIAKLVTQSLLKNAGNMQV